MEMSIWSRSKLTKTLKLHPTGGVRPSQTKRNERTEDTEDNRDLQLQGNQIRYHMDMAM
jgi:hypothetical protein